MNLFKIMQSIRAWAQAGKIDYPGAIKYLNDLGVQMDGIVKQALDNVFKKGKARDPDFGDTVVKMQIDEEGIPFNPKTLKSTTEKRNIESLGKDATPLSKSIQEFFDAPKAKRGVESLFEETTKVAKEPKYGTLDYDRIAKQEGVDVEEIRGKSFREIIEYLSAVRDKADGGRVGYANGGLNLSGEAQNIYNSWMNAGHTHQEALDYLASRGMYEAGGGGGGVESIINTQQSIIPGAGGDSRPTGPDSYTQTWTSAGIPTAVKTQTQPIGLTAAEQAWREGPFYGPKQNIGMAPNTLDDSIRVQALAPADAPPGFLEGSIEGELDYTIPGTSQIFDLNTRKQYQTPRTIGDQVYAQSLIDKETGIKTLGVPPARTGLMGMWDKTKDFFSGLGSPKVRGTLGTRLANQPRIPLPASMAGWSLSPFNEASRNYNPNMIGQLNFLEMQDNMIGRDPNSGHLKYGPESVLAGKNVISMFGTNNYEQALKDWIEKMEERGTIDDKWNIDNLSKFQREKYLKGKTELENLVKEQQRLEEERKKAEEARKAGIAAVQQRVDQRETNINRAAAGKDSPSGASTVNPYSAYGKAQGYTGGNPNPHTATGWSGSSKSSKSSSKGNNPWGRKDGGPVGLATMFTRRR